MSAMLALLGSAELIVKASEQVRSRAGPRLGFPRARGVGAPRACSRLLLGAVVSSSALVRFGGAARRGSVPSGGGSGALPPASVARLPSALPHGSSASRAQSQPWKIVGFSIYGFTLVSLFVCSTLHHGLEGPPAMERGLRIADYCAIYPLIAGACANCARGLPARLCSRALSVDRHLYANLPGLFVQQRRGLGYLGHAVVSDVWRHRHDCVCVRPPTKVRRCGTAWPVLDHSRLRAGGCR